MGNFALRDFKYIYIDDEREEILIDFTDNLSNKGRIPFHSEYTDITVNTLILDNMDKHDEFCLGNDWLKDYIPYYVLLDVIVIREHIKSKFPKKIIEFGAYDDIFGKHARNLLREMHPQSEYLRLDNDDSKITNEDDKAEVVYINGTTKVDGWDKIISAGIKHTKHGGLLLCFDVRQKELEDAFIRQCGQVNRYSMNNGISVLTARY